ncbi:MAG: flippase-like domain-containing protein [Lachnospiraceae bacterium]|nr:flippase-like domain-containing protein [Lachnospiraceae bacterium]
MLQALSYIVVGLMIVALFLLIHICKMMRMYLVLIDTKIEFRRFTFAYFRTTLINLVIPFKLGEIYRAVVFYRLSGSLKIGVLSVIVDRFFDTLALVLIIIPLILLYPDTLSFVTVMLSVFLVVIVFIYRVFPPAYRYLNNYIIINRTSKRSMAVLRVLSILRVWYDYVRNLVSGRYSVMLLLSFGAWIVEGILLLILSRYVGISFGAREFCEYITSILSSGHETSIQKPYTWMCIVLIAVMTIISGTVYFIKGGKPSERPGS